MFACVLHNYFVESGSFFQCLEIVIIIWKIWHDVIIIIILLVCFRYLKAISKICIYIFLGFFYFPINDDSHCIVTENCQEFAGKSETANFQISQYILLLNT